MKPQTKTNQAIAERKLVTKAINKANSGAATLVTPKKLNASKEAELLGTIEKNIQASVKATQQYLMHAANDFITEGNPNKFDKLINRLTKSRRYDVVDINMIVLYIIHHCNVRYATNKKGSKQFMLADRNVAARIDTPFTMWFSDFANLVKEHKAEKRKAASAKARANKRALSMKETFEQLKDKVLGGSDADYDIQSKAMMTYFEQHLATDKAKREIDKLASAENTRRAALAKQKTGVKEKPEQKDTVKGKQSRKTTGKKVKASIKAKPSNATHYKRAGKWVKRPTKK